MTTRTREIEIFRQEQDKSALERWIGWLFLSRPTPRKYARYTGKRFNPVTRKVE